MEQPRRKPRSKDGGDVYVGNYKLVEEIGKGSFALVYLGEHTVSGLSTSPRDGNQSGARSRTMWLLCNSVLTQPLLEVENLRGCQGRFVTASQQEAEG